MRQFSLLIKPASADCNFRCRYCFYLDKGKLYPETKRHRMADAVLEKIVASYMATEQQVYAFGWQGGEPTLMGAAFFNKVIQLQMQNGQLGVRVANGLQTNASLVTDELAQHLAQYNFLVGCSLDGPAIFHDSNRRTIGGKATSQAVMAGIEKLKRHNVAFNILTLVNHSNVRHAVDLYRFFVENSYHYQQYIPCVEFDEKGSPLPFAVSGEEWGEFLCNLFDQWYPQDVQRISIRNFDAVLQKMIDGTNNNCAMGDNCCQYFVVEYNGDIYPCDFFVEKKLKIGNIMDTTWEEALDCAGYRIFGDAKACRHPNCGKCDFLSFCMGDCLKHRTYAGNSPQNFSWLCGGWKIFFQHTLSRFQEIAAKIKTGRILNEPMIPHHRNKANRANTSIGRNRPCPCGSGEKYKRCCGR